MGCRRDKKRDDPPRPPRPGGVSPILNDDDEAPGGGAEWAVGKTRRAGGRGYWPSLFLFLPDVKGGEVLSAASSFRAQVADMCSIVRSQLGPGRATLLRGPVPAALFLSQSLSRCPSASRSCRASANFFPWARRTEGTQGIFNPHEQRTHTVLISHCEILHSRD